MLVRYLLRDTLGPGAVLARVDFAVLQADADTVAFAHRAAAELRGSVVNYTEVTRARNKTLEIGLRCAWSEKNKKASAPAGSGVVRDTPCHAGLPALTFLSSRLRGPIPPGPLRSGA